MLVIVFFSSIGLQIYPFNSTYRMNSPSNDCVIPMPALSLILMGRMKVLSSVGAFLRVSLAAVAA